MKESSYFIFGYGSIIWDNEDLEPIELINANLVGAHRSFNKKSNVSRGTKTNPGLVLGLEYGGECQGKVIQIKKEYYSKILKREGGYEPINSSSSDKIKVINTFTNMEIDNCIVFFPNPNGPNFINAEVDLIQKAEIIKNGRKGKRSDSKEYLSEIRNFLKGEGIIDAEIEKLYELVFRSK